MYSSEYWLNIKGVWANWPNREISYLLKWYLLVQFAFWLQQIIVINIEERRKDHWQMFSHHILTCILLFTSYEYYQTRIANLILCLMDVVDILLPVGHTFLVKVPVILVMTYYFQLAKCLKYVNIKLWPDIVFGISMVIWIISRHILYLIVCYSVWVDTPAEIPFGCYEGKKGSLIGPFPSPDKFKHLLAPFGNPEGVVCFHHKIKWAFLIVLLTLHGLTLFWFLMIVRVAANVLRGGEAEDTRSDDEGEHSVFESLVFEKSDPNGVVPLEEKVRVKDIEPRISSTQYRKTRSSSKRVTLADHNLL
jgi:acyl-CoA-dependent ceramide synthase